MASQIESGVKRGLIKKMTTGKHMWQFRVILYIVRKTLYHNQRRITPWVPKSAICDGPYVYTNIE